MRPHFGHIENVPPVFLGILWIHYLKICRPAWEVFPFNCFKQILDIVIGIGSSNVGGFFIGEAFDTLIGFHVELDILEGAIRLSELVSVPAEGVSVSQGRGRAAITEEMHEFVRAFLIVIVVIPELLH
jgi:hypothetical protein